MARARRGSTLADVVLSGSLPATPSVPVEQIGLGSLFGALIGAGTIRTGNVGDRAVDSTKTSLTHSYLSNNALTVTGDTNWHSVAYVFVPVTAGANVLMAFASCNWYMNKVGVNGVRFKFRLDDNYGNTLDLNLPTNWLYSTGGVTQHCMQAAVNTQEAVSGLKPGSWKVDFMLQLAVAVGDSVTVDASPAPPAGNAVQAFVVGDNT